MEARNPYEHLRNPGYLPQFKPLKTDAVTVYAAHDESVTLVLHELQPDRWAYGYSIVFADGRHASRQPGEIAGWFHTARTAQLYFYGYMLKHHELFSQECTHEVKTRILKLIQGILF